MSILSNRLAKLESRSLSRRSRNLFVFAADPRDADAAIAARLARMPERDREHACLTVFSWLTPESGSVT